MHGRRGFTLIELLVATAIIGIPAAIVQYGVGSGNGGGNVVYRLREGMERFLIADINNPAGAGSAQSNALYMNGHVKFIRCVNGANATPPVTPAVEVIVGGLFSGN